MVAITSKACDASQLHCLLSLRSLWVCLRGIRLSGHVAGNAYVSDRFLLLDAGVACWSSKIDETTRMTNLLADDWWYYKLHSFYRCVLYGMNGMNGIITRLQEADGVYRAHVTHCEQERHHMTPHS